MDGVTFVFRDHVQGVTAAKACSCGLVLRQWLCQWLRLKSTRPEQDQNTRAQPSSKPMLQNRAMLQQTAARLRKAMLAARE
jgi:hypothetical protein